MNTDRHGLDVESLIAAWRTNNRVTTYLIENFPPELWSENVPGVPRRTVRPAELLRALERSSEGIIALIRFGAERGGSVPPAHWQNFPTDLVHFLNYFVAHEAHHRGQLILIARQLGHRLPRNIVDGLWQWKTRSRE
ncbi:MAG TPA: DinB family protein [Pyrinomonadaceae bacterium]|nr:DinB family protein [Pyrinomonadaceae bacterium]